MRRGLLQRAIDHLSVAARPRQAIGPAEQISPGQIDRLKTAIQRRDRRGLLQRRDKRVEVLMAHLGGHPIGGAERHDPQERKAGDACQQQQRGADGPS